ncbi:hypothetical protein [Colwellia sp. E150_009]|jgi:hypothetical protein
MSNALDENAKLDVNISNLLATEAELEKLKELIVNDLGNNTTSFEVTFESSNHKGDFYEISFTILKPKSSHRKMINN